MALITRQEYISGEPGHHRERENAGGTATNLYEQRGNGVSERATEGADVGVRIP